MTGSNHGFGHGLALALGVGTLALATIVGGTYALGRVSTGGRMPVVTVSAPATSGTTRAAPKDAHVLAGAYDFTQFSCEQCHGIQGRGGVSPYVPALTTIGKALTASRLKSVIDHGLGVSANPKQPFMPVWGPVISQQQATDLVAYIKAGLPDVQGAHARTVPPGAGPDATGAILYTTFGCINCHGPNGLGGVPNPLSPDKSIPPLSGADFRKQFNTPAKIRQVIQSGSVIGGPTIVSMPHWGGIISRPELDALVAYISTLR